VICVTNQESQSWENITDVLPSQNLIFISCPDRSGRLFIAGTDGGSGLQELAGLSAP